MTFRMTFNAALLAASLGLSAQTPMKAPAGGKLISDELIGIFFEDISSAADGGLYGEPGLRRARPRGLPARGGACLLPLPRPCHGRRARGAGLSPVQFRQQRRGCAALRPRSEGRGAPGRRARAGA